MPSVMLATVALAASVLASEPAPKAGQAPSSDLPPADCVRLVREARLAEASGEVDRAMALLTEAQESFPRQILPLRELLRIHRDRGTSAERLAELRDLFRARLTDLDYPLAPGTARFLVETATDDEESLEVLRVGLEARLERESTREYLEVLAVVQGRLGRYAEARETLGRLLALEATYPVRAQAIRIDLELERWESALELLAPILEDEERGISWTPIYIELLAKTGRAERVVEEIERLRREGSPVAHMVLTSGVLRQVAWDLYDAGDTERSERVWQMVLEEDPTDLEAQLVLANLFSSEAERSAREAAVAAQLEEEVEPAVLYQMGLEYLTAGDDERAYDLLSRAVRHLGGEAAWFNLGLAALRLERWEETVRAYAEATRLNDQRAESFSHLATGLRMLERYDEAARAFERAVELDPARTVDYYYLSECYRALGETEKAARARREYDRLRSQ